MRRILIGTLALLGALALPKPAHAGFITGQLDFSGGAQVSLNNLNWFLSVTPCCTGPQTAAINGSSIQDGGVTVANLQPPNLLTETNLNFALQTPGTSFTPVQFFETEAPGSLPALPILNFVLTAVTPCSALGGGVTCLAPNSAFGLLQQGAFVAVTLVMSGTVFDTATPGMVSTWSGLWTANVPGTVAGIAAIIAGGGTVSNSYSGTKITAIPTAVPEPATLLTFGLGSLALARYRRRKKA
jgi:PEP-CTERM motif